MIAAVRCIQPERTPRRAGRIVAFALLFVSPLFAQEPPAVVDPPAPAVAMNDAATSATLSSADIARRYLAADRSPETLALVATPAEMAVFFELDPPEEQRARVEKLRADYVAQSRALLAQVNVDVPAALLDDATPPKVFIETLELHLLARFPVKQEAGGYQWTAAPVPVPLSDYQQLAEEAMRKDAGIAFQLLHHPILFEIAFQQIVEAPAREIEPALIDGALERLAAIAAARDREHELLLFLLPSVGEAERPVLLERFFLVAEPVAAIQFAYAARVDDALRPLARDAAKSAVDAALESDEEIADDRLNALLEAVRALGDE